MTSASGSTTAFPLLARSGRIGALALANRMIMAAMGTRFATDTGAVSDQMIRYFERRAQGGVGLCIVQAAYVTPLRLTGGLSIDDDRFTSGLNNLAERIKFHDCRAAIQLQHQGALLKGGKGPADMDAADFREVYAQYASAAFRAKEAGFEAIELHCAHGYLIHQFLSPLWNPRTDEYGGSQAARTTFVKRVIDAMRERVGAAFPLIVRISAEDGSPGGNTIEDTTKIAAALAEMGVNAIDVSRGNRVDSYEWVVQPMAFPRGVLVPFAAQIAETVDIPVIAVGRINNPELAETILASSKIAFIAFGRGLIADPDLPAKSLSSPPRNVRRCTACNYCHGARTSHGLSLRCAVNAEVGNEGARDMKPAAHSKRVLIAGSGPAGMEAARILALRGHRPIMCERESEPWAMARLSAVCPHKEEWLGLYEYQTREAADLGIEIQLNTPVDAALVNRLSPDAIVIATGSKPLVPKALANSLNKTAFLAQDILRERVRPHGKIVIAGGGYVAVEIAEWLHARHQDVRLLLGRNPRLAYNAEPLTRKGLLERLAQAGIDHHVAHEVTAFEHGVVGARDAQGAQHEFACDTLVLAIGMLPNLELADALSGVGIPVTSIGDCRKPRGIAEAVLEGYAAAWRM